MVPPARRGASATTGGSRRPSSVPPSSARRPARRRLPGSTLRLHFFRDNENEEADVGSSISGRESPERRRARHPRGRLNRRQHRPTAPLRPESRAADGRAVPSTSAAEDVRTFMRLRGNPFLEKLSGSAGKSERLPAQPAAGGERRKRRSAPRRRAAEKTTVCDLASANGAAGSPRDDDRACGRNGG